jgi:tetratricopeptide (TPR) repeat protein
MLLGWLLWMLRPGRIHFSSWVFSRKPADREQELLAVLKGSDDRIMTMPSGVESCSDEAPGCQICRLPWDEADVCPRMLECGHSYCTSCISKLCTKDFPCPTDRRTTKRRRVEEFPKNFGLLSALKTTPPSADRERRRGKRALRCEPAAPHHNQDAPSREEREKLLALQKMSLPVIRAKLSDTCYKLAAGLRVQGEQAEAVARFELGLQISPDSWQRGWALANIGFSFTDMGPSAASSRILLRACGVLQSVVVKDPRSSYLVDHSVASLNYVTNALEVGQIDAKQAEEVLLASEENILKFGPTLRNKAQLLCARSRLCLSRGELEESQTALEEAWGMAREESGAEACYWSLLRIKRWRLIKDEEAGLQEAPWEKLLGCEQPEWCRAFARILKRIGATLGDAIEGKTVCAELAMPFWLLGSVCARAGRAEPAAEALALSLLIVSSVTSRLAAAHSEFKDQELLALLECDWKPAWAAGAAEELEVCERLLAATPRDPPNGAGRQLRVLLGLE